MDTNFWKSLPRPIIALAPMVGVTDSAFRQIAKRFGADVVYSEMVSADALVHESKKTIDMLRFAPEEQPLVVQLMGKDPSVLAQAARFVEERGVAGIDINFGCPAHKIARNYCGAALMRDPDLCKRLIAAVIEAVSIPVSIKVRASIRSAAHGIADRSAVTVLDMLEHIQDLPLAAIMVHGRSFEDPFEGGIRTDVIRAVKERFMNGPVLANGGVTTIESAREVLNQTGADGLGLARSVIGRPWVIAQVKQYLATESFDAMAWEKIKMILADHVALFDRSRNSVPFREIRRHLTHYVRGHERASELRQKLTMADSPADVSAILATA